MMYDLSFVAGFVRGEGVPTVSRGEETPPFAASSSTEAGTLIKSPFIKESPKTPPSAEDLVKGKAPPDTELSALLVNAFRCPPAATNPVTLAVLVDALAALKPAAKNGWPKLRGLMHAILTVQDPGTLVERFASLLTLTLDVADFAARDTDMDGDVNAVDGDEMPEEIRAARTTRHFVFGITLAGLERFYAMGYKKVAAKHAAAAQVLNWLLDVVPVVWRTVHIPRTLLVPTIGEEDKVGRERRNKRVTLKSMTSPLRFGHWAK